MKKILLTFFVIMSFSYGVDIEKESARTKAFYESNCIKAKLQSDNLCGFLKYIMLTYDKDLGIGKDKHYADFYAYKLNMSDLLVIEQQNLQYKANKPYKSDLLYPARYMGVNIIQSSWLKKDDDKLIECVDKAKDEKDYDKCFEKAKE